MVSILDSIPESLIRDIIDAFQFACGDGINSDQEGKITHNGRASSVWDIINTELSKRVSAHGCIARPIKRGPWQLLPLFEESSGSLLTLMRKSRFQSMAKKSVAKRGYYYVSCLAAILNCELTPTMQQMVLDGIDETDFNMEIVSSIVKSMLADFGVAKEIINHHAVVIFDTWGDEVRSVKCVIINSAFDIVEETDWSAYLKPAVSLIVETVDDPTSASNTPAQGLSLTKKARERKQQQTELPYKQISNEEYDDGDA